MDGEDPLEGLLREVVRTEASDLLPIPGHPPTVRIDGSLQPLADVPAPDGDKITALLRPDLSAHARTQLETLGAADFSLRFTAGPEVSRDWRFRVNLQRQAGQPAAALRALPRAVPSLADLNLPPSLERLVDSTRGLVLVCGPTGSGKSSTLAALVHAINRSVRRHVITIEDPVEYEHRSDRSLIEQIEVGRDTRSFADALRAALRQDPDVLLEFATLPTHDSTQAIHRIVDAFPATAVALTPRRPLRSICYPSKRNLEANQRASPIVSDRNQQIAHLVDELRPRLHAILRNFQIPPADRDDVLQDALLALVRRWDSVRHPRYWLLGTLNNCCRLYWRTQRQPSGRFVQAVDDETLKLLAGPIEPVQSATPLRLALAPILGRLDRRGRRFLVAHIAGHTPRELGERTGYAADTVRGVLRRARATIRRALGDDAAERPGST